MYVCICNALTERCVRQAIEAGARERVTDVYAACGCQAKCGQCMPAIWRLMQEYAATDGPAAWDAVC